MLDERSLTRHPFYPDAPSQSAAIPMIIGNTHDETRAFLGGDPSNFTGRLGRPSPAAFSSPNRTCGVDIDPGTTVIAEYRRLYPAYSASDVLFAATTASRSWRAAVIEAEANAPRPEPRPSSTRSTG